MNKANTHSTSFAPNRRQVLRLAGAATALAIPSTALASPGPDTLSVLYARWREARQATKDTAVATASNVVLLSSRRVGGP